MNQWIWNFTNIDKFETSKILKKKKKIKQAASKQ